MTESRYRLVTVWRELAKVGKIGVSFSAFSRWARVLGLQTEFGLDAEARKALENFAALREAAPRSQLMRNGEAKAAVIAALFSAAVDIDGRKQLRGADIMHIAEVHGAASRATLYRRFLKKHGARFASSHYYPLEQAKNLIIGV